MSTLSKETTEAPVSSTAAAQTSAAGAQPKSSSGQLHSDAVSLEVPLKVHGSKLAEAAPGTARGVAQQPQPFEEETSSMIVFPHGGVLRMSTSVNSGQMLVLTNLKSRQDAICRVVKVRSYSNSSSYVEVEFTHRQPGFWGVYFESDALADATPAAPLAPPAETPSKSAKQSTPAAPSAAAPRNLGSDKNATTFISIGSQEDVQLSASLTSDAPLPLRTKTPLQESRSFQKQAVANIAPPSGVRSAASQPLKTQAQEDEISLVSETAEEQSDAAILPSGPTKAARAPAEEAFGSRLDAAAHGTGASEGKKNGALIAACIAALLVGAGGVFLYSRHMATDSSSGQIQPQPATQQQAVQQTTTPAQPVLPSQPVTAPASRPAASAVSNPNNVPPVSARTAAASQTTAPAKTPRQSIVITQPAAEPAASAPGPTPAPAPRKIVPNISAALNAHPVATRRRADGIAAPSLDAVGTPGASADPLAGIASPVNPSAPALPSPSSGAFASSSSSLRVSAPVQSSAGPKEPKLLVRVIPEYPPMARQTHTEGDVVLAIAVDNSGNVTEAKVLSGPTVLRMAALGAVRRWKYEALGDLSSPARMTVTIQFRL
jgi:TonB family protein